MSQYEIFSSCRPNLPLFSIFINLARNVRQLLYYSFIPRCFFLIDYRSIWCRDFTIICITKELEVKMLAYTSFISDVHKFYRLEKIVLQHLIFYLSRLVSVYWFQTQFYHNYKYKAFIWQSMWNEIGFGTN